MSTEAPSSNAAPTKGGEISLEDLDQLLESEDPGFTQSLESVRAIESDASISIDPSAMTETEVGESSKSSADQTAEPSRFSIKPRIARVRERVRKFRLRIAEFAHEFRGQAVIFVKSRPKELFFYLLSTLKILIKQSAVPIAQFRRSNWRQRFALLGLIVMVSGSLWILLQNTRGIWLPALYSPLLHKFAPDADFVEEYSPKVEGVNFNSAFPQERHEFLFGRMKVNLRRTPENPLPMGAFELSVLVDSKDTAIEVSDREVEFSDLLQRVFEDESFADLETESGKGRVKSRLKRELNQKLTQGWVKDINFKTFILKP